MRCYYHNDKEIGKVLIPYCYSVIYSNDIKDCTCDRKVYYNFEKERYNKILKEKEQYIKHLEAIIKNHESKAVEIQEE